MDAFEASDEIKGDFVLEILYPINLGFQESSRVAQPQEVIECRVRWKPPTRPLNRVHHYV